MIFFKGNWPKFQRYTVKIDNMMLDMRIMVEVEVEEPILEKSVLLREKIWASSDPRNSCYLGC